MATFFHVTSANFTFGEDLLSWDSYVQATGETPGPWKWEAESEGLDSHLVSLLREDQADEINEIASFIDGDAVVLTIVTDEGWDAELGWTVNDEGYTCVYHRIPAECIVSMEPVN